LWVLCVQYKCVVCMYLVFVCRRRRTSMQEERERVRERERKAGGGRKRKKGYFVL